MEEIPPERPDASSALYQQLSAAYNRPISIDPEADSLLKLSAGFLSNLTTLSLDGLASYLHEEATYQQPPLPTTISKKSTTAVCKILLTILTSWELTEIHSVSIGSQIVSIERTECFNMKGIELYLPGTLILEFKDDKVIRITDYIDFLTCIAQTFIGLMRLLLIKILKIINR